MASTSCSLTGLIEGQRPWGELMRRGLCHLHLSNHCGYTKALLMVSVLKTVATLLQFMKHEDDMSSAVLLNWEAFHVKLPGSIFCPVFSQFRGHV